MDGGSLVWTFVWALMAVFVLYTAILTYHWFRYSHTRSAAMTTTVVYLLGASICILLLLSAATALTT